MAANSINKPYTGRFAPSPTGPLHFGSLTTALASFLDARTAHGKWLVRMEDIDPPREQPGAATQIIQQLQSHGLIWDGALTYQHQRHTAYRQAIEQLLRQQYAFRCGCSRTQLQINGGKHNGICKPPDSHTPHAIRLHVPPNTTIAFNDLLLGHQQQNINALGGDFVILRKDRLFAYQLAVVVDDAWQGITHVVRGSDLLGCTGKQLLLQQQLSLDTPYYKHLPVVVNSGGQKLSKQTHAAPIETERPSHNLCRALTWLGLPPPDHMKDHHTNPKTILSWAMERWPQHKLTPSTTKPAP